ncbi:hypothetical protein [Streptomyces melanogenes]|uniref:DUF11 domain-containing protein n=1 Tax=Streptomyces melanogenes TaxID=67326 RepID=A0ABZ1XBP9_9ACTN|nr:hypothetical protein [Streptomyces melanogenes]
MKTNNAYRSWSRHAFFVSAAVAALLASPPAAQAHPAQPTPARGTMQTVTPSQAVLPDPGPAPHAAPTPAIGKVEFTYSAPEVSENGDEVTWTWTVRNTGTTKADKVVLTHKTTPVLKAKSVPSACEAGETSVRCEYGTLQAGESREGKAVFNLPADLNSTVQINGRVTWQQQPPS